MNRDEAKKIIEVLLFANEKPLAADKIAEVLDGFDKASVEPVIEEINNDYAAAGRPFTVIGVGGGFQIMTDPVYAPWVRKLFTKERKQRLSRPSLETLAIIAYRQPITKADIEVIRGVNADGVIDTLMERNLIRITGRKDVIGKPFLYGTSKSFLTHFGLNSLEDLPRLNDFTEDDIQLGRDELIKKEDGDINKRSEADDEKDKETVEGLAREDRQDRLPDNKPA